MRLPNFIKIMAVIFLAGAGLAFSEESGSQPDQGLGVGVQTAPVTVQLTLQKAEELALAGNPDIRASEDRAKAADQQILPSLFPDDPQIMVDTTFPGMEMWQVEEKLGFPGKGIAKADMYGAESKKMQAMALDEKRNIVLRARQAYWDFYFRQKVDGILQDAQSRWKDLSQIVQSRELSGQWLSVKAVRMQMETANAFNDLITNSRALRVSQFNLNHLFSLPNFTAYELVGEPDLPPLEGKEEDWVNRALKQSPEIKVYQKAIESQEATLHMASLDYLPDFDLTLSGVNDPNGGGLSNFGYRLGVSIPLFFPAKQSKEEGSASDLLEAAHNDLKGKQNEVIHMTEDAYVSAESAWRILRLYEEGGLLKQTQRAWESSQVAYRNEQMPLSDFIETYNTYLQTLMNYYQAKADYGKALAQLEYEADGVKGDGHENQ